MNSRRFIRSSSQLEEQSDPRAKALGGPDIFMHISALQSVGVDPVNLRLGERLTFDVESGRDGKTSGQQRSPGRLKARRRH